MTNAIKHIEEEYSRLRPARSIEIMGTTMDKVEEKAGSADLYSTAYARYESLDHKKTASVSIGSVKLLNPAFGRCHPDINEGTVWLRDKGCDIELRFDVVFEDQNAEGARAGRRERSMSLGHAKIRDWEFERDVFNGHKSGVRFLLRIDPQKLGRLERELPEIVNTADAALNRNYYLVEAGKAFDQAFKPYVAYCELEGTART